MCVNHRHYAADSQAVIESLPPSYGLDLGIDANFASSHFDFTRGAGTAFGYAIADKGGMGMETFRAMLENVQCRDAAEVENAYIAHGDEWWERCKYAYENADVLLEKFTSKATQGALPPKDLEQWTRLQGLLQDYAKYKDQKQRIDRFEFTGEDSYGVYVPSAPALRDRAMQLFGSKKDWYVQSLAAVTYDNDQLIMDATFETAKKINGLIIAGSHDALLFRPFGDARLC